MKSLQLYGRNDMVNLYKQNKVYGSLGVEEPVKTIDKVATGEQYVVLTECVKDKFKQFKLLGNSVQQETPSPEFPQEIKNVGKYNDETQKYDIDIAVNGKNLFKTYGYSCETINGTEEQRKQKNDYGTSINTTEVAEKLVITQKGLENEENAQDYKNGYVCIGIVDKLIENKEYFFSADIKINSNPLKVTTFTVLANGIGSGEVNILNNKIVGKFIWKSYNERRYLELRNAGCSIEITNIMISYVKNIEYEPYREPQTVTLSLNQPLRGIGEYKDVVTKDGIVRRIKQIVWNGSENWSLSNSNLVQTNKFYLPKVNDAYSAYRKISSLVDALPFVADENSDELGQRFYIGNPMINLDKEKFPDVDTLKQWLSENPMTVQYALAEPIIEPLAEESKKALESLHTNEDTTVISVDGGEVKAGISVTYKSYGNNIRSETNV